MTKSEALRIAISALGDSIDQYGDAELETQEKLNKAYNILKIIYNDWFKKENKC